MPWQTYVVFIKKISIVCIKLTRIAGMLNQNTKMAGKLSYTSVINQKHQMSTIIVIYGKPNDNFKIISLKEEWNKTMSLLKIVLYVVRTIYVIRKSHYDSAQRYCWCAFMYYGFRFSQRTQFRNTLKKSASKKTKSVNCSIRQVTVLYVSIPQL